MSNLKQIRLSMGMTQTELAQVFGQTKGNISHYESGNQDLPVSVARQLIDYARTRGINLDFDAIYADPVGADNTPSPESENKEAA